MIIGLPREIQNHEYRAALTPDGVTELARAGGEIVVETGAGLGSGFEDDAYADAGARVAAAAEDVWREADFVVKVKEPIEDEFSHLREGLVLFAYLHTPPRRELTQRLLDSKTTAIAYENVTAPDGSRPLLAPMSEIAGKMAVLLGAQYLQKLHGGAGVLLAGVSGLRPPVVVILGGGVAGTAAALAASGLGNDVYVLELMESRISELHRLLPACVHVLPSTAESIAELVIQADVLINCTVWPNPMGTHLVTRPMLATMKPSAVIIDVSVDPKGSIETTEYRTHSDPTFVVDGILHYCVPNLPGIVARTSTLALTSRTLPYIARLAERGVRAALTEDEHFRGGLSTIAGLLTDPETAEAQARQCVSREVALGECGM